jgi:hypothetical protein
LRAAFLVAALAACSDATVSTPPPTTDGGAEGAAPGADASPDAAGDSLENCDGVCRETQLTVTLNGKTATFMRAQFGFTGNPARSLHVEAFVGGDPACPTTNSRTPDHTWILDALPVFQTRALIALGAGGMSGSLVDFKGTLVTTPNPAVKFATLQITPRALRVEPRATAFVSFEVDGTFEGAGTMKGPVFATHCDSMDER